MQYQLRLIRHRSGWWPFLLPPPLLLLLVLLLHIAAKHVQGLLTTA
jgi:hypothetical protein